MLSSIRTLFSGEAGEQFFSDCCGVVMVLVGLLGLSHAILRSSSAGRGGHDDAYTQPWWWIWACICIFLVLFAGIMSGLTLGLMSLGLMDLEVLQQSGTDAEKKQASMSSSLSLFWNFLAVWNLFLNN